MTNIGQAELSFTLDTSDLDRSLGRVSTSAKREGQKAEKALAESIKRGGASGGRAGGGAFVREMSSATNKAAGAIRSALSKAGEGILQGVGQQLTGIAVQAGGAVRDFLGSSIAAAGDYNRAMGGIRQTIEQTGGAAQRSAEQLDKQAQALGRSTLSNRQEVLKMQQALLTFKSVSGDVFDDAVELSLDLAAAMGTDAKGAAIQLGKALENPTQGVSALSRAGVTFNDQQKEQIKSLQEQNDLYGAQQVVLKALEGQLGGVAQAQANGTGGALDTLNEEINDLKIALGQAIAPAVEQAFTTLSKVVSTLSQAFQSLSPESQRFIAIGGAVVAGVTAIAVAVGGLAVVINTGLIASMVAAVAAAAPFIAIGAAIGGAIALVVAAVAAAVGWWDSLSEAQKENVRENQPLQAAIGATIDAVREVIKWVGDAIPVFLEWANQGLSAVVALAQGVGNAVGQIIEFINAVIVSVLNWQQTVAEMRDRVVGFFTGMASETGNLVTAMGASVSNTFSAMAQSVLGSVQNWVRGVLDGINRQIDAIPGLRNAINLLGEVKQKVFGAAINIVKKTSDTVGDFAKGAVSYFKSVVSAVNPLKKALGDVWDLAKKAAEAVKGLGKFIPGVGGEGGGNPLEALKALLGQGAPATAPGQSAVFNPFGGRVTGLASTTPHHSYQHTAIGLARDVTLEKNGSTLVPTPSPLSGVVEAAGWMGGYGNAVIVRAANGMRALLGHFERLTVKAGQAVQFGQTVGIQGSTGRSTGPHIHIEAAASIIDRWLKFISGSGEFALSQRERGGGDPITIKEKLHYPGDGHNHGPGFFQSQGIPMFGIGGGDAEDVAKSEEKTEEKISELEKIQAAIAKVADQASRDIQSVQTDVKLGLRGQLEAEEAILAVREESLIKLDEQAAKLNAIKPADDTEKSAIADALQNLRAYRVEIEESKKAIENLQLEQYFDAYAEAQQKLAIAQAQYSNDVALGILTEQEGLDLLLQKRTELGGVIAQSIPGLETFMATASSPEAVLKAQELLEQIRGINAETAAQRAEIEEAERAASVGAQLNEKLLGVGKSFKDGIIGAIVEGKKFTDVLADIGKQLAKLALNFVFKQLFGGLLGGGGGASFFGFRNGGIVPNYASGGIVGAIGAALQREGPNSVLAALTPGEQVLSRDNGDAQFFRHLQSTGQWAQLRQINNYRNGGVVGRGAPTARSSSSDRNIGVTVDRINNVDYVSLNQLSEILAIRDPQVAAAGASLVEDRMQSSNWRRSFGVS